MHRKLLRLASLRTRVALATLITLLLGLWAIAWYLSAMLRSDITDQIGVQQLSTVSIVAAGIDKEIDYRFIAMETIASEIDAAMLADGQALQALLENRPVFQALFNGGTRISRLDGTVAASVPYSRERLSANYADRDYMIGALQEGRRSLGKPTLGKVLKTPVLGMAVPIRDSQGATIGAVVGAIKLAEVNFLAGITHGRFGNSGGYMLFAPRDNIIVAASDPNRVMQPAPKPGINPMYDRYVGGYQGFGIAVSSRGIEELSAARAIPSAGWFVVGTLPTAEAFAPLKLMQRNLVVSLTLLSIIAGTLIAWLIAAIVHRQLKPMLETTRMLKKLSPSQPLPKKLMATNDDEFGELIEGFNQLLEMLHERQRSLHESEELYRTAFATTPDAVNITGLYDGVCLQCNDRFVEMTGWSRAEVVGSNAAAHAVWADANDRQIFIRTLTREGFIENMETRLRCRDGRILVVLVSAKRVVIRDKDCVLTVTCDVTARKQIEEEFAHLAFHDPLTRLPNRRLMLDRLSQAVTNAIRHGRYGAVMLLDLDNFKTLNDTLGHEVGDQLLVETAVRLQGAIRAGDTVARLGGDEFVIILSDLEDSAEAAVQAEAVALKIQQSLSQAFLLNVKLDAEQRNLHSHQCTSSIGITLFREANVTPDELLRRADTAMYQAKHSGRNAHRFFEPAMQADIVARARMEAALRQAIVGQEFVLHYQAQVGREGNVIGAEALVRWQSPELGLVSPALFIPLAESTGLILPIGHWVLSEACRQLALWAKRPLLADLKLAVNISARQFGLPRLVDEVLALIDHHGIPADHLKLELTESLLLDNADAVIERMSALKLHGVSFSLDDFGTGYSSLSYLKRLPLSQLKIDQSFVREVVSSANDATIARAIIALAHNLGLNVIAEGVETQAQRDLLEKHECDAYQGYYFSKPLPIEEFERFVHSA